MIKALRSGLDFLLFSNVFIAGCAAAQVAFTYEILSLPPNFNLIGLIFFATLALYNFSMLLSKPKAPAQSPFRRVRWIFAHQRLVSSLSIIAVFGACITTMFLHPAAQVLLGVLALISVAYNLPLLQLNKQKIGLRNIPGIKIFIIAGVWTLSTWLLPLLESEQQYGLNLSLGHSLMLLLQRFLLVMAITIPFDIRDLYQDKRNDLKTLPVYMGEDLSYRLCQLLLILSLLLGAFTLEWKALLALAIASGMAAWLILKSKWERNEYYYFFYLDGVLILPWILLQAINYFLY